MNISDIFHGKKKWYGLPVLFSSLILAPGYTSGSSVINFSGNLISVSCQINNDQPINIEFDAVLTHLVDGVNYQQSIDAKMTCSDDFGGDVNFIVDAEKTDFSDTAIQTNVSGLGIKMMLNDNDIELKKPYKINAKSDFSLSVVPVKDPASTLPATTFTATASLIVETL